MPSTLGRRTTPAMSTMPTSVERGRRPGGGCTYLKGTPDESVELQGEEPIANRGPPSRESRRSRSEGVAPTGFFHYRDIRAEAFRLGASHSRRALTV
ncbi:hypothetical protein KM043_013698 [Ampulex compressa]|nr:hypothetical protein KM043_013698 [Ampulex compressa]